MYNYIYIYKHTQTMITSYHNIPPTLLVTSLYCPNNTKRIIKIYTVEKLESRIRLVCVEIRMLSKHLD